MLLFVFFHAGIYDISVCLLASEICLVEHLHKYLFSVKCYTLSVMYLSCLGIVLFFLFNFSIDF